MTRQHGSDAVLKDVKDGALEGEVGVKQAAHQDTDKQGGVNLLGDQRQGNGDDRGQQSKGGSVEVAGRGDHTFAAAGGAHVGPFTDSAGGVGAVALHADAVALAGRALHGGAASALSGGKGHAHQGQNQDQRQHDPAQPASVHSHSSHFPPKISSTGTTNTHDISPGALAQQKTMNAKRAHGKTGCPLSAEKPRQEDLWIALHKSDSPQDLIPRPRSAAQAGGGDLRRFTLSSGTAAWPYPGVRMRTAPLSLLFDWVYPTMLQGECQG